MVAQFGPKVTGISLGEHTHVVMFAAKFQTSYDVCFSVGFYLFISKCIEVLVQCGRNVYSQLYIVAQILFFFLLENSTTVLGSTQIKFSRGSEFEKVVVCVFKTFMKYFLYFSICVNFT